ncbi:hypothetical protein [Thermococcus sp. MV11]|uniref:hypothetical protein n=1 Tax=Thermococcus sp. MV11 TaxID=1638267 RepID=UPI00352EC431
MKKVKLSVEHKFSLTVYLWGLITGIISGVAAAKFQYGWLIGLALYLVIDKFVLAVVKELPPDVPEERAVLRKAFWGWALFWLYFTMLSYSLMIGFTPQCYSNQSLLYQMVTSGNATVPCNVTPVG